MSCSTEKIVSKSNAYVLQMRQPVQSTSPSINISHHSPTVTASTSTTTATAAAVAVSTISKSSLDNIVCSKQQSNPMTSRISIEMRDQNTIPHPEAANVVDYDDNYMPPTELIQSGMWWRHLVAGALAGAVSRTCTAPLDRTKVMLQVKGAQFNTINACMRHMMNEGGFLSLWRGNGMNVMKIAPESALKFLAYEQSKLAIKSEAYGELDIGKRFIAGSIAGSLSQTVIYPLEVLKTRLCLRHTGQYKGVIDAALKIFYHEGIKAFYRGYLPNLIGIIPYAGIDLAVYETLKNHFLARSERDDPGVILVLFCGFISSSCGMIASYPLSLIRTRLQANSGNDPNLMNMRTVYNHITRTEGYRGLYRGLTPNFLKVAPAVAISYVVYEHTRSALGATMT